MKPGEPDMKEIIHTDNAPKAIGPYSQAVKVGNLLFTAGQVAFVPETGELNNATVEDEMTQVMRNLGEILKAGGSGFDNVVKTTIFVSDLAHYAEINSIYARYFGENPPARSTVEVSRLPRDVRVEIEMVAIVP